jgi:chromosomal replication initiation ATPase DnaA
MTTQLLLDFVAPPRVPFTQRPFFRDIGNQEVMQWIDSCPKIDAQGLVIIGSGGVGKTHVAHLWVHKMGRSVEFLTPQTIQNFVESGAYQKQGPFYVMDDMENFPLHTQESLFHLYNHVKNERGALLVTSQSPPQEHMFGSKDLASRIGALPRAYLKGPTDDTLKRFLYYHLGLYNLSVDGALALYIIERMGRTFLEIEEISKKLAHAALGQHKNLTLPIVRHVLQKELI